MADQREEILNFVKEHGPILPSHAAKAARLSILFASAYLSELADKKHIKISWIKVGGSPLYYAPGQEEKLEKYIDNLNDKDKEVFLTLKLKRLLKDSEQIPLVRVSLRNLKDFAVAVEINGELYWRFFNVTEDEIKKIFMATQEPPVQEIPKQEVQAKLPLETAVQPEKLVEQPIAPVVEVLQSTVQTEQVPVEQKKKRGRPKKIKTEEAIQVTQEAQSMQENQPSQEITKEESKDPFIMQIEQFFIALNIDVAESILIKKSKEAEFIVMLPTPFGKTKYFCKALNKKSIADGDVSSAVLRAHYKKLPGLLVAPGKLTKRAQEMLEKEAHGLLFKQI